MVSRSSRQKLVGDLGRVPLFAYKYMIFKIVIAVTNIEIVLVSNL